MKVKANSGSSVSFMIIPKKLGQVTIKVTATSNLAGDSVVQNLLVKVSKLYSYVIIKIFKVVCVNGTPEAIVSPGWC